METIKIGWVGLGVRGCGLLRVIVLPQGEKVTAVCDPYEDRAQKGADLVTAAGQECPNIYTDYRDLINDENVNTVVIASAWESHVEVAVAAMKA